VALGDALRGLAMFEKLNVPIIGVVENMSGDFFGEGGGARLAAERHVPFLGSVPLDPAVRVSGDGGKPILTMDSSSPAAAALLRMSQQVAARVSQLNFSQSDNTTPLTTIG
jgi:ATP-binding protein involved in chromosome partitioning